VCNDSATLLTLALTADKTFMTLEPWMLRTALVGLAMNGVNLLLLWKVRSLERQPNDAPFLMRLKAVRQDTHAPKPA
jgi:hypothetical protein